MQKVYGLGILLITHDIDVALKMGDDIIIISEGKIQETMQLQNINKAILKTKMAQTLANRYTTLMNNVINRENHARS